MTALHDKEKGVIALEMETNELLEFSPPRSVVVSSVPDEILAVYVSLSGDQSALIRIAGFEFFFIF